MAKKKPSYCKTRKIITLSSVVLEFCNQLLEYNFKIAWGPIFPPLLVFRLGFVYRRASGIDLRCNSKDEWYSFEVNPSPGYTYFSNRTGQKITEELGNYLLLRIKKIKGFIIEHY